MHEFRRHSVFAFEKLEPRILLSADAVGGILGADLAADDNHSLYASADHNENLAEIASGLVTEYGEALASPAGLTALDLDELGQFAAPGESRETRHELIVIDSGVDNHDLLLQDLVSQQDDTEYHVILLDGHSDGIVQISTALEGMETLDAIHLLSHGNGSLIQLGDSELSSTTIDSYAGVLAGWADALGSDADILVYGCELASSDDGRSLLSSLSELTGADVAGSDDRTGASVLGGDWVLEYQQGSIETAVAFSNAARQSWVDVLAAPTTAGIPGFAVDADSADSVIDLLSVFFDAEDAGNTLAYSIVANSNPGLFAVAPAVDDLADTLTLDYDPARYGSATITVRATDSEALSVDTTFTVDSAAANTLWFSTKGDVSDVVADAGSISSWDKQDLIQLGGVGFQLGAAGTSGTLSEVFDIENFGTAFAAKVDVDAAHYVTTDLLLGTANKVAVQAGDLILSTDRDETLTNSDGSTLDVKKSEIFVFHPDTAADYTSGSFARVFEAPALAAKITGVTLVESDTTVGDKLLEKGTLLLVNNDNQIYYFTPGDLGDAAPGTFELLVDGSEMVPGPRELIPGKIYGIELIENDIVLGGAALGKGTLLLVLKDPAQVMDNGLAVPDYNIFSVELTKTTLVNGSTAGVASELFDGADINLVPSPGGELDAVTLKAPILAGPANNLPTGVVTIDNPNPLQGDTLTATNTLADADGLSGPVSYQWLRDGLEIPGETNATYTTGPADASAVIAVKASYTDDLLNAESKLSAATAPVIGFNNAPTGTVSIDILAPLQGDTLEAANTLADADGLSGPISYQWQRDGLDIVGATGASYTTGQDDVDSIIAVRASYTDDLLTDESKTSAATVAVGNVNDTPSGAVLVSGGLTAGKKLNADASSVADVDGLAAFDYQWLRAGVPIAGATGTSYTLTAADVGATLSIRVSYVDAFGTPETIDSAATGVIAVAAPAPPPAPTPDPVAPPAPDPVETPEEPDPVDEPVGEPTEEPVEDPAEPGPAAPVEPPADTPVDPLPGDPAEPPVVEPEAPAPTEPEPATPDAPSTGTAPTEARTSFPGKNAEATGFASLLTEAATSTGTSVSGGEGSGAQEFGASADKTADVSTRNDGASTVADGDERADKAEDSDEPSAADKKAILPSLDVQGTAGVGPQLITELNDVLGELGVQPATAVLAQVDHKDISSVATVVAANAATSDSEGISRLREMLTSIDDVQSMLAGGGGFVDGIDQLREDLRQEAELQKVLVGSGFAVTSGFSVGYVLWIARSGVLLSSVLSSMPAWRLIDPFPVLGTFSAATGDDADDDDSLQAIADHSDKEAGDSKQVPDAGRKERTHV